MRFGSTERMHDSGHTTESSAVENDTFDRCGFQADAESAEQVHFGRDFICLGFSASQKEGLR